MMERALSRSRAEPHKVPSSRYQLFNKRVGFNIIIIITVVVVAITVVVVAITVVIVAITIIIVITLLFFYYILLTVKYMYFTIKIIMNIICFCSL